MDKTGITVVVATYNRAELLKDCLKSLLKQDYGIFEIIVVDDGSTDSTKAVLDEFADQKIKKIFHQKNQGLSSSRNTGIDNASFDLIAFTDDDCTAKQNWLTELALGFDGQTGFVFGQTVYVRENYTGKFPQRIIQNLGPKWPMGNNLCYRKAVFDAVGKFDPEMDYYHNDDSEMAIRAFSGGFLCKPLSRAVIYHQKTYWTPKSLIKSSRNPSVWVTLKNRYPEHFMRFGPPIKNFFINPGDYWQILLMPILLPLLFFRFLLSGQRNLKLFFIKWPLYPFLRRFYIYREALRQRTLML